MTAVLIPPACVGDKLAGPPTSWPRVYWEFYLDRVSMREEQNETPAAASRNAAEDVRRWRDQKGEEWIEHRGWKPQETKR